MVVKIAHAVMDENGGKEGPTEGDQTGKEITIATWYAENNKGAKWDYYLLCTDVRMREEAAQYIQSIAKDDNFGYSQGKTKRWSGYKSILKNNKVVKGAKGDFDCSSLVISSFIFAGLNVPATGYTGSMLNMLKATGKFIVKTDPQSLDTDEYATRGGIYLRDGHVLMVIQDGDKVGQNTSPVVEIPKPASDYPVLSRISIENVSSWCNVRLGPDTTTKIIGKAYKDESYNVIGMYEDWYMINYKGNVGYVHSDYASGEEPAEVNSDIVTITAAKVNVRRGPATTYPIVAVVYKGDTFGYLGETSANGWYKISRNGIAVYVSGALSKLG